MGWNENTGYGMRNCHFSNTCRDERTQPIDAIDIDRCYLNSIENAQRNNCKHITVYEGEAALLEGKKYDLIITNINRNILMNDMQAM
jgi:ribosomal protein L11 methylase PrmA